MNDTTAIATDPQADDVRAYVGAVRAWLGDLPPEEVEDLTAGMEADLAERAAESGDTARGAARRARGVCRRAAVRGRPPAPLGSGRRGGARAPAR